MNDAEVQSAVDVIIFSTINSFLTRLQLSHWNLLVKLRNLGEKLILVIKNVSVMSSSLVWFISKLALKTISQ